MTGRLRSALLALAALALGAGCSKGASPAACTAGQPGCVCRVDGSCAEGLSCEAGACAPCVAGRAACPCLGNGSCDAGLACLGGACGPCVAGTLGCGCGQETACDAGLECQGGACVVELCAPGTLHCRCLPGDVCGAGLYCAGPLCESCTNEVAGCPCEAGACEGLICAGDTCRAPITCATAGCGPYQRCLPGTGMGDASCLAECEIGFTWNPGTSACDPIPDATCAPGADASIAAACAAAHRSCVEDALLARCGGCVDGFLDESGTCRAVRTCDDLACAANHLSCTPAGAHADASCGGCVAGYARDGSACVPLTCAAIAAHCDAANELCVEPSGGGAVCEGCKPGFVEDVATGACREPYTCATLPSPCPGGQICQEGTALRDAACRDPSCPPCTAQGEDGPWPERTADGRCICKTKPGFFYSLSGSVGTFPCDADGDGWIRDTARYALNSGDAAIRVNARCALRLVDRFVLHNDGGQTKTLTLDAPLPLYETVRNDDQARLDLVSPPGVGTPEVPLYGTRRTLRAAELNSLTKACAGEKADFNDNNLNDVSEWGRPPLDQAPVSAAADLPAAVVPLFEVYTRYSYFIELHHGWYAAGAAGAPGSYHIAERDRTVGAGDGFPLRYGVDPAGGYTSDLWQDCRRGRDVWYSDQLPAVTMDFASASPPSRAWKGMTHHSQFKCVQVVDDKTYLDQTDAGRQRNRHLQTVASLADPSDYYLSVEAKDYLRASVNVCGLSEGASRSPFGAWNPQEPELSCEPRLPDVSHVGRVLWAAVRISESSRYYRGCILQCAGSPAICPGTPPGELPEPCYSMCADTAASAWRRLAGGAGGYRVEGEVPVAPLADRVLGDVESGLRVHPR